MKTEMNGLRHARNHAFALVSNLRERFSQQGISESDFWEAIKAVFGVESRKQIDECGYVKLAARLQAAERETRLFESLCCEIKKWTQ